MASVGGDVAGDDRDHFRVGAPLDKQNKICLPGSTPPAPNESDLKSIASWKRPAYGSPGAQLWHHGKLECGLEFVGQVDAGGFKIFCVNVLRQY